MARRRRQEQPEADQDPNAVAAKALVARWMKDTGQQLGRDTRRNLERRIRDDRAAVQEEAHAGDSPQAGKSQSSSNLFFIILLSVAFGIVIGGLGVNFVL